MLIRRPQIARIFFLGGLSSLFLFCAKTDDSTYDCRQTSDLVFDGAANYRDTTCTGIPNALQIRLSALVMPSGGNLILRPYSSSNDNGFYVSITPNSITTAAANAVSGAAVFNSGVDFTTAKNLCLEIHDITKEKHIIAVYQSLDCFGSPSIDSTNALVSFGENRIRYAGTTGITLSEMYLKKTAGHSH